MKISTVKRVYCIGLGGVGVSAVAKYFLLRGAAVSGSDLQQSLFVQDVVALGGTWYPDHDASRITPDFDLVVYTDDCGPDHPERAAAVARGIPCQNFSATLGLIMRDFRFPVAVSGTNGKSTTTAILALLLRGAHADPTIFVGSRLPEFDSNFHLGGPDYFVAEADEYHDHFLNLNPRVAVINNIELDHVDYFSTLDAMIESYRRFVARLPADGALVLNGDDPVVAAANFQHPRVIRFGFGPTNDLQIVNLQPSSGVQRFSFQWNGQTFGPFDLHRPGVFNAMNAAAAVAAALGLDIAPASFPDTIAAFKGIWRRFEILNPGSEVVVVNDYAHHPTAVAETLAGARAFYPGRRIIAVFQPHHQQRLHALFDLFTKSFRDADETVIVETYAVRGREIAATAGYAACDLAQAVAAAGSSAQYAETPDVAAKTVRALIRPGDIVIIMGAGSIWKIAAPLAAEHPAP